MPLSDGVGQAPMSTYGAFGSAGAACAGTASPSTPTNSPTVAATTARIRDLVISPPQRGKDRRPPCGGYRPAPVHWQTTIRKPFNNRQERSDDPVRRPRRGGPRQVGTGPATSGFSPAPGSRRPVATPAVLVSASSSGSS